MSKSISLFQDRVLSIVTPQELRVGAIGDEIILKAYFEVN